MKDEAGLVLMFTSSTCPAHDFPARRINLSTKAKERILRKRVQVIMLHFVTSSLLTVPPSYYTACVTHQTT
jgi:hypothetical protein